ncbi:MAG: NAD(+)/NADH kinase [Fimbriimonadaceae bacterium]|nr:NAD(+)/NADH kinase [Fimbriimonadaceae bacterium]
MSQPLRTVGLVVAPHRADALAAARRAVESLTAHHVAVSAPAETATLLSLPSDPSPWQADLVLVLGGDGSVISALRAAAPHGTPVVAVNYGTVGFLTQIAPADLEPALEALCAGRWQREARLMLEAQIWDQPTAAPRSELAANDVVIKASDPSHVLLFRLDVCGERIAEFPADGLIISTPTGSTAYSLSAGGPVLVPDLPALVVTPICPHTLATRPVVLSAAMDVGISLEAVGPVRQAQLAIDGRVSLALDPAARLMVRRAPRDMYLARLERSNFFASLREKLRWGSPK